MKSVISIASTTATLLAISGVVFTPIAVANSKMCWLDPVNEITTCANDMGSSNSHSDEKDLHNNVNKGRCWSDGLETKTCSAW